jgi:hypothetical protein
MEIRIGQVVASRSGPEGVVIALSVSASAWTLRGVLVEPEHRLGLGRWVPFELLEDDEGDALAAVDHDGFEALQGGETTELVEAVRTSIPFLPTAPVIRRVAKEVAARGERVLNADTPLLAGGAEIGQFGGLVVDPSARVESLLSIHHKMFCHSEEFIPIEGASLSNAGIRLDG